MTRLRFSRVARQDRVSILAYVANQGGVVAHLSEEFDAIYTRIAIYPESCQERPALGSGIRVAVVGSYLVLYRYDRSKDLISVLRILHGRRSITSDFMKLS